ncbi:MAG: chromosomal replication initiator protein DnaA [Bacteroides sp.]|nr:chromosomal replication initiator protein DnaA [Bacteroides sp.]
MTADFKQGWQKCLEIIRDNIGQARYETWFACARPLSFADNMLTLQLPTLFYCEQYEDTFLPLLKGVLRRVFGPDVKLRYKVGIIQDDAASEVIISSPDQSRAVGTRFIQSLQKPEAMVRQKQVEDGEEFDSQLNPILNFENYCVGDSNRLAFTIAEHVSRNLRKKDFNPFFLYGPVGVGKTHLIQAIGIRVKEKYPHAKVLFTTLRQFQNLYANAVMQKKIPGFISWFQQMDYLLIDDLQELSGKTKTSEALFPIFNHLHQNGKQLIFTCDRPPMELDGIADRLIDRFKWGVTEKLPQPDYELRRRILTYKATKNGLALPSEVIDIVAENATNSVRELEGIVMGILTRAITDSAPITVDLARQVMKNSVKVVEKRPMNFEMIVEATANYYHLNPQVVYTSSRVRDIADARQVIMYLAHKMTGLSSTAIGTKLNRRHATVLHGIAAVRDRIAVSGELSEAIETITSSLQ